MDDNLRSYHEAVVSILHSRGWDDDHILYRGLTSLQSLDSRADILLRFESIWLAAVCIADDVSEQSPSALHTIAAGSSVGFVIVCNVEQMAFYNDYAGEITYASADRFPVPDELYNLYLCYSGNVVIGDRTKRVLRAGVDVLRILASATGVLIWKLGQVICSILSEETDRKFVYVALDGSIYTNIGRCESRPITGDDRKDGQNSRYGFDRSALPETPTDVGRCRQCRFGVGIYYFQGFEELLPLIDVDSVAEVTFIEHEILGDGNLMRDLKRRFTRVREIVIAPDNGRVSCKEEHSATVCFRPELSSRGDALEILVDDMRYGGVRVRPDWYVSESDSVETERHDDNIGRVETDIPPVYPCDSAVHRKTVTYNKVNINSNIMARRTSFEHQIELAENLRAYLHGFQERLGEVAKNYREKCNDLYEAGMMDETYADFEQNYMRETIIKIANVVEQINDCDIPFVEKYIGELEDMRSNHSR